MKWSQFKEPQKLNPWVAANSRGQPLWLMNNSLSLGWVSTERIKMRIEYMLLFNELNHMSIWHIGQYDNYPYGFVCFYGYARIFIFGNPKEQNVIGVLSRNTEQLHLFGTFPKLRLPSCVKKGWCLVCQPNVDAREWLPAIPLHVHPHSAGVLCGYRRESFSLVAITFSKDSTVSSGLFPTMQRPQSHCGGKF